MIRNILTVFGLISFLVLPQHARANQLTNGDFESPVVSPSDNFNISVGDSTSITGWTVTQGNVDLTSTACCFTAFSGVQDVDLVGSNAGNGGLKQTFATTVGQEYALTLYYSRNYTASVSSGGAQITSASATVSVTDSANASLLAATVLSNEAVPALVNNRIPPDWQLYSGLFTADSILTTLTINNLTGGFNGGIYLDDVSVDPVSATTPIPGTLPLFVSGLGGVVFLTRRRRQKIPTAA